MICLGLLSSNFPTLWARSISISFTFRPNFFHSISYTFISDISQFSPFSSGTLLIMMLLLCDWFSKYVSPYFSQSHQGSQQILPGPPPVVSVVFHSHIAFCPDSPISISKLSTSLEFLYLFKCTVHSVMHTIWDNFNTRFKVLTLCKSPFVAPSWIEE